MYNVLLEVESANPDPTKIQSLVSIKTSIHPDEMANKANDLIIIYIYINIFNSLPIRSTRVAVPSTFIQPSGCRATQGKKKRKGEKRRKKIKRQKDKKDTKKTQIRPK